MNRLLPIAWGIALAISRTVLAGEAAGPEEFAGKPGEWIRLFDGQTLAGWKSTEFGGEGEVKVEDGAMILEMGEADLTGANYVRPTPRMNYEIELEAMRVDGEDFFCGLTFPVGDSCCSLIVGGWAGRVVGISSLDGLDASENETSTLMDFEKNQWYKIRVRVTADRLEAWIGDEKPVDANTKGREIAVRAEVDPSQPFGVAAWNTKAALKNIRLRLLTEAEIRQSARERESLWGYLNSM